jgi:hypothetical protein
MPRVGVGRFDMLQKLHSFLQKLQPVPSSHPIPPHPTPPHPTPPHPTRPQPAFAPCRRRWTCLTMYLLGEPHPRQEKLGRTDSATRRTAGRVGGTLVPVALLGIARTVHR